MELDLKKEYLDIYETGGTLTLTQEETAETIVPDYCPDIARIIETEGTVCIRGREIRDGKAEVSGTIRVTVLYTPDGEGGIRMLEFALPFTVEGDQRMPGSVFLMAEVEPELLETRMLNPRKVFTHCRLNVRLTGYQKKRVCICADVEVDEALRVEKRQEHQHTVLMTHIAEKDFTFSDELHLSPGRDGAAELLSKQVRSTVTEIKIVGNKLIFKGLFHVSVLYRTIGGTCGCVSGDLPFSQIMEVERVSEGAKASLYLQLTGAEFHTTDDDPEGRRIEMTLYFHAAALLHEEREIVLLNDLYSTTYEMSYEASPLNLYDFFETMSRRQTVREVLEIGTVAESVLSVSVRCGAVSVSRERGCAQLRTGVVVRVLYLDEGGVPLMAERCVDVSGQVEVPEECQLTAHAVCWEEVQAGLGDRGIEVRFPVDFNVEAANPVKRLCITSANLDPTSVKDLAGAPSLVLRRIGKEESLWDLAKQYHTTISAILSANQMEQERDLPTDQMILIPKKRA